MLASKSLGALSFTDPAWNVANAQWLGDGNFIRVSAQVTQPTDMFIKPDGTKVYITGDRFGRVYQYDLSTAWNISTATFVKFISVSAQESTPQAISFKPDGTKMYVLGYAGDDVNEYSLSTAWDISTAVFVQVYSVSAQETIPLAMFFKPDGTKMYVLGQAGDAVNEYDLSTAWDVSTATYLQNFSVSAQEATPTGLFFKPDGTKMYVSGDSGNDVNEYNLSTAWDVSTASFLRSKLINSQDTNPTGVFFKDDGTVMYISGDNTDTLFQYQLSTAWDVSTATYADPTTKYFSVATEEIAPTGLFFKPDGTKLYIIGFSGDDVNEYDLSTAWDVSTATYLQNFSVATQETIPRALFFKPDGTKMYILGGVGLDVGEYNLSTAWDISTLVFLQFFSISAQDTVPTGLYFRDDGLKMYVVGDTGNDINEYSLSTAWDVSTAVFLQLFFVGSQETIPFGVFFKPDGTKMYVVGQTGDDVNEYTLSTPWNVTTATFVRLFSFVSQTIDPTGIFFRDNGLQMYIISNASDAIWEYDLV